MKRLQTNGTLALGRLGLVGVIGLAVFAGCVPAEEAAATGGSGGTTNQGGSNAGGSTAGSGGSAAGSGGSTAGAGGSTAGSGGSTAGAGGSTAGAGGSTAGSGGSTAGAGGAAAGAGGSAAGAGGSGPPLEVGKACTTGDECPGGVCLGSANFPGGYCSKVCSGDIITQGDPCPAGAACIQFNETTAVCLDRCASKGDCRADYACKPYNDGKDSVCVPACKGDGDCQSLEVCDTATGLCKADMTKKGKPGDPCTDASKCDGNMPYCFTDTTVYPGGMCTSVCSANELKQSCPNDPTSNCFAADFGAGIEYDCFRKCKTSVDCRDGYICTADAGADFQANDKTGACVPSCKSFPCGDGYVCDPTGVCVANKPNIGFEVTKQDLGTISVNSKQFQSVEFTLPADTLSFSVVANPLQPVDVVVPIRVTAPNGVIYDYFDPTVNQYKTAAFPNIPYASLYPNSPRLSTPAGTYKYEFGATAQVDVKVDVLFKKGSGVLDAGKMPMVFFFTEGLSINATTAKSDPTLQAAIVQVKAAYASVGIDLTVDDSSYIDLPNSAQYAVIDDRNELASLFAAANSSNISGLNFFFLDQYAFENGAGVLGVSGGIPGSPGLLGTTHAGVSVAYSLLKGQPDTLGIVMAHEGGHYLGLFHPTEAKGTAFDPLDDTPECPASKFDSNGDGRVDHEECASAGTDNMMFWLVNGPKVKTFTSDQKYVLMRNPLVSH